MVKEAAANYETWLHFVNRGISHGKTLVLIDSNI